MWYYRLIIRRVWCFITNAVSNEDFSHKQTAWSYNGTINGTDRKCDPSKLMVVAFVIQNTIYLIHSLIISYSINDSPLYCDTTSGILNPIFGIIMLFFVCCSNHCSNRLRLYPISSTSVLFAETKSTLFIW